ncbi:MAG: S-layer homology domain-containing protein [Anaerovoracaceae bacterium]
MKHSKSRRILSALLAAVVVLAALPAVGFAGGGTVTVQISNPSTYNMAAGAPFEGALDLNGDADGTAATVPISAGDTAMDAIASALNAAGYTANSYNANGYNIDYNGTYLNSVNGLSAGAASIAGHIEPDDWNYYYDGWSGVINDISPPVGFSSVYVSNGDVIRLEYSLDFSVSDSTVSGTANTVDSGFDFSAGTLSSTGSAATYDLTLTLTLPASATSVQVSATPCTKTPVVVYDATGVSYALNSDIPIADGDVLQIVGGNYEEVFTVNVNLIGADDIDTLLENIAAGYTGSSDQWTVIDMAAYLAYNPNASSVTSAAAIQALIDNALAHVQAATPKEDMIAKDIVALQSVGIDPSTLYLRGETINLFDTLDNTSRSINNVASITLHAYRQDNTVTSNQVSAMFGIIEGYKKDGKYIYDFWEWGGDEVDIPAQILASVAPFASAPVDNYGVKARAIAIRDAIIDELDALTQYASGSLGNANTDAMVIIGLAAAGIDAGSDARFKTSSGLSLVDGLLSYALTDLSGFGWANNTTKNSFATEQGFRALIAAREISGSTNAYNIYDFSSNAVVPGYGSTWIGSPVHFALIPEGASVSVNGQTEVTPGVYDLVEGTYDYTVSKSGYQSKTGSITVFGTDASNHTAKTINVSLASIPALSDDITVSIIIKMHPSGSAEGTYTYKNNAAAYTTIIASQSVSLKAGSTVFDALDAALTASSVGYIEKTSGYIKTIDGISELDYGPYSGWLYMVNGKTATVSCRSYNLNSNASIVWFYTDDYTKEYGSEKWTGDTLLADSSTLTPSAAISGNSASATLSASDLSAAIQSNTGTTLTIEPTGTKGASAVEVNIPAASAASIASDTALDLSVVTPVGTVTIPNDALGSIASQASGSITIRVESVDTSGLSAEQQQAVGQDPVYDISILSGGTQISSFAGKAITISLPYELKEGEDASGVAVWYLNDAGELQRMRCTYDPATGMATFETTHLSKYLVGYSDAWYNPFEDVRTGDWFYDAVAFAANNQLFDGVSKTAFAPDQSMTRAMLAAVLHRAEGSPAATAAADFGDVESGQWYSEAIAWATERGITKGYDSRTFGTNDSVTREQMAEILYRYAEYKKLDVSARADVSAFGDGSSISSWAEQGVLWAVSTGLIQGVSATKLAPSALSTRAQVATVLMRWLGEK